jgi:hypothetical protein
MSTKINERNIDVNEQYTFPCWELLPIQLGNHCLFDKYIYNF